MQNETTWVKIPNYTRYEAGSNGQLRSVNYKNSGRVKELKPAPDERGYLKTMLQDDTGKYVTKPVHYFVALAFLGVRPAGLTVNHVDGIKTNNRPDNLGYITHSENVKHAFKNLLMIPKRGELNGMAKLTEQDVREIRSIASVSRYYGRKELAVKYGVSEATIKSIVTRRRNAWPHIH